MFVFQLGQVTAIAPTASDSAMVQVDNLIKLLKGKDKKLPLVAPNINKLKSLLDGMNAPPEWKAALGSISAKAKEKNFDAAIKDAAVLRESMQPKSNAPAPNLTTAHSDSNDTKTDAGTKTAWAKKHWNWTYDSVKNWFASDNSKQDNKSLPDNLSPEEKAEIDAANNAFRQKQIQNVMDAVPKKKPENAPSKEENQAATQTPASGSKTDYDSKFMNAAVETASESVLEAQKLVKAGKYDDAGTAYETAVISYQLALEKASGKDAESIKLKLSQASAELEKLAPKLTPKLSYDEQVERDAIEEANEEANRGPVRFKTELPAVKGKAKLAAAQEGSAQAETESEAKAAGRGAQGAKTAAQKSDERIPSPLTADNFAEGVEAGIAKFSGYGVTSETVKRELTSMIIYANKFLVSTDETLRTKKDAATNLQLLRNSKLNEPQMRTTSELALISSWVGAGNARGFIKALGNNFTFGEDGNFTRKSDSKNFSLLDIMKDKVLLAEIGAPEIIIRHSQRLENSLTAFEGKSAKPIVVDAKARELEEINARIKEIDQLLKDNWPSGATRVPGNLQKLVKDRDALVQRKNELEGKSAPLPKQPVETANEQFTAAKERINALATPLAVLRTGTVSTNIEKQEDGTYASKETTYGPMLNEEGELTATAKRELKNSNFPGLSPYHLKDLKDGKGKHANYLATKQLLHELGAFDKKTNFDANGVPTSEEPAGLIVRSSKGKYSLSTQMQGAANTLVENGAITQKQLDALSKALASADDESAPLYKGKHDSRPIDCLVKIETEIVRKSLGITETG